MNFLSSVITSLGITSAERMQDGSPWYSLFGGSDDYRRYRTSQEKRAAVLTNPAALYVFTLLPDLYSLGKYKLTNAKGEEVTSDPLLTLLKNPNPLQTESQFKWSYMFYRKLGTANVFVNSDRLNKANKLYMLDPDLIEWSDYFRDNSKTLILSESAEKELKNKVLYYLNPNGLGKSMPFKYKQLLQFFDISNGLGSWFGSPSRVDALYKIIQNSDEALNAKKRNVNFMRKFLVAGKAAIDSVGTQMLSPRESNNIEAKLKSGKDIHPLSSMVDIKRFIDDYGVAEALDKSFLNDAFKIGKVLNIPKDVLEVFTESGIGNHENKEKARASIIAYCIQPDANDFCEKIIKHFEGYEGWKLELDYSHLPFVQVLEAEKAKVNRDNAATLLDLIDAGADQQEAGDSLGFGLTMNNTRNENRGQRNQQN